MSRPRKTGIIKECLYCKKEQYVFLLRSKTFKFCSKSCFDHYQSDQNYVNCANCNKEFRVRDSKMKINKKHYCSIDCHYAFKKSNRDAYEHRSRSAALRRRKTGKNSSRYARDIAFSEKLKQCEICNYNEHDFCLDIHHKDKNPNNNDISNLMVLCCICHRKLHKNFLSLKDIQGSIVLDAQELIK